MVIELREEREGNGVGVLAKCDGLAARRLIFPFVDHHADTLPLRLVLGVRREHAGIDGSGRRHGGSAKKLSLNRVTGSITAKPSSIPKDTGVWDVGIMRETGAELLQISPTVSPNASSKIDDRKEHDQKKIERDDCECRVKHF
jgi:hypothetical protein